MFGSDMTLVFVWQSVTRETRMLTRPNILRCQNRGNCQNAPC